MPHRPGVGAIFGVVSENGVAKPGAPVYLLDMRRDMGLGNAVLIAKQFTKTDGGFVFNGLDPNYADYAVFTTDEDSSGETDPYKNALIRDRIQPISAHTGATWLANWWAQSALYGSNFRVVPYNVVPAVVRSHQIPSNNGIITNVPASDKVVGFVGTGVTNYVPYGVFNAYYVNSGSEGWLAAHGVPTSDYTTGSALSAYTFECVLDLTKARNTGVVQRFGYNVFSSASAGLQRNFLIRDNYTGSMGSMFYVIFTPSTNKLALHFSNSYDSNYVRPFEVASEVASINLTSYSGIIHIAIVWRIAASVVFYVNGSAVSTITNTAVIPNLEGSFLGYTNVGAASTNSAAVFAMYPKALTATEVQTLSECVINGRLPVLSGYMRQVFTYHPMRYYRMNDVVTDLSADLIYNWTTYGDSKSKAHLKATTSTTSRYVFNEPSPVVGGNSVRLFGSSSDYFTATYSAPYSIGNNHQLTFSGWVKLAGSQTNSGELYYAPAVNDSTIVNAYITTNLKPALTINVGGTDRTYTSSIALTANQWYFIVWTVSLYPDSSTVKLYIGTDSVAPTLAETFDNARLGYTGYLYDLAVDNSEWSWAKSARIGYNFNGWLAELALIPAALTSQDVVDLWNAKDVP